MKRFLSFVLAALFSATFAAPIAASAACNPFFVVQGGTGNCGLNTGFIPFGGATATTKMATSSGLFFTAALNRLTFTNGSSTLETIATNLWLPSLGTAAGTLLAADPTGKVIATSTVAAVTSVTGTYPVISSGGVTPAISLAFGTTTANTWSGLQAFTNVGTTTFSAGLDFTRFNLSATSTGSQGINLSAGCFAVNNTCIGSGSLVTGTTGQVVYLSGTNSAIGTSSISIGTNSFVGIASSTPSAPFTLITASSSATTATSSREYIGGLLDTTNYVFRRMDQYGHIITGGPTPTTTCTSISGDDTNGSVTCSTTATATVTFARPFPAGTIVSCAVTLVPTVNGGTNLTTTATSFNVTSNQTFTGFYYHCEGHTPYTVI